MSHSCAPSRPWSTSSSSSSAPGTSLPSKYWRLLPPVPVPSSAGLLRHRCVCSTAGALAPGDGDERKGPTGDPVPWECCQCRPSAPVQYGTQGWHPQLLDVLPCCLVPGQAFCLLLPHHASSPWGFWQLWVSGSAVIWGWGAPAARGAAAGWGCCTSRSPAGTLATFHIVCKARWREATPRESTKRACGLPLVRLSAAGSSRCAPIQSPDTGCWRDRLRCCSRGGAPGLAHSPRSLPTALAACAWGNAQLRRVRRTHAQPEGPVVSSCPRQGWLCPRWDFLLCSSKPPAVVSSKTSPGRRSPAELPLRREASSGLQPCLCCLVPEGSCPTS